MTEEYLDLEDLLSLTRILDADLLESAAARPLATVFGADAYPDLHHEAAALLHSWCRNHALVDGNKRLSCLVIGVAEGTADVPDIARRLAGG